MTTLFPAVKDEDLAPDRRLFVAVKADIYFSYRIGSKTWELRVYGRNFTEKNVMTGRKVELRKGYSVGESLLGVIGEVVTGSLEEILTKVDFKKIIPGAWTKEEAIAVIEEIMPKSKKYIAFEVRPK